MKSLMGMMGVVLLLSSCQDIYDEPQGAYVTVPGQLYVDASDKEAWHYIDLEAIADSVNVNSQFNPSSLWKTYKIPVPEGETTDYPNESEQPGIYTYWYDVFGAGLSNHKFRHFIASSPQAEPENWTFAVHNNNVRTNAGAVCETAYTSFEEMPLDREWLQGLSYTKDVWNETDVWVVKDKMLLGLIGNQGIGINPILGRWLTMKIPPMPPAYTLNPHVFILRLDNGTYAALRLVDYMDAAGNKYHLRINYKYPL